MASSELLTNKNYIDFVERYAFDLVKFAVEVCGMTPTWQQIELLQSVQPSGSRTTVRSGHGTGKSRSIAVIVLWHLLCYPDSNTLITAPKIEQVRNVAWKEIVDVINLMKIRGNHAWIAEYVEAEAERIFIKNSKQTWFVIAKTAPRGSPENLAGMHRDWYLIIADEASGIPDQNYSVLTGALTDKRNRMCMFSQPTRSAGFFYDSHNKLSTRNGGVWNAIQMDSRLSPLVSEEFIKEKKQEYTVEEFTIKVIGDFPESRDGFLISRSVAEACFKRENIIKNHFGYILSCDVGAGEYRDKSVAVLAKISGFGDFGEDARRVEIIDIPVLTNTKNINDFSGTIFNLAAEIENVTVLVDAGGMGIAVCQNLESNGLGNVHRVKWGNPCFKKQNKERFFNLRAQAVVGASKAAKDGRLSIKDGFWKRDLLDEMTRLPYHFDEKARYVIEKKEEMRKQGIHSPDIFDAISFLFLENITFMLSEKSENNEVLNSTENALLNAEKMFEDIF